MFTIQGRVETVNLVYTKVAARICIVLHPDKPVHLKYASEIFRETGSVQNREHGRKQTHVALLENKQPLRKALQVSGVSMSFLRIVRKQNSLDA